MLLRRCRRRTRPLRLGKQLSQQMVKRVRDHRAQGARAGCAGRNWPLPKLGRWPAKTCDPGRGTSPRHAFAPPAGARRSGTIAVPPSKLRRASTPYRPAQPRGTPVPALLHFPKHLPKLPRSLFNCRAAPTGTVACASAHAAATQEKGRHTGATAPSICPGFAQPRQRRASRPPITASRRKQPSCPEVRPNPDASRRQSAEPRAGRQTGT